MMNKHNCTNIILCGRCTWLFNRKVRNGDVDVKLFNTEENTVYYCRHIIWCPFNRLLLGILGLNFNLLPWSNKLKTYCLTAVHLSFWHLVYSNFILYIQVSVCMFTFNSIYSDIHSIYPDFSYNVYIMWS